MIPFRLRSNDPGNEMASRSGEERTRPEAIYTASVVANVYAGKHVAGMQSEAWREATKETREVCQEALDVLDAHRNEHGC